MEKILQVYFYNNQRLRDKIFYFEILHESKRYYNFIDNIR